MMSKTINIKQNTFKINAIEEMTLVSIAFNQKKEADYLSSQLLRMNSLPKNWIFVDDGSSSDQVPDFPGLEPTKYIYLDFPYVRNPKEPRIVGVVNSPTDRVVFHSVDQIPIVRNFFDIHSQYIGSRDYVFSVLYRLVKNFDYGMSIDDIYNIYIRDNEKSIDYGTCLPGTSSFSKSEFEKTIDAMSEICFDAKEGGEDTFFRRLMWDNNVNFYINCSAVSVHIQHKKRWKYNSNVAEKIENISKKKCISGEPPIKLLNFNKNEFLGFSHHFVE